MYLIHVSYVFVCLMFCEGEGVSMGARHNVQQHYGCTVKQKKKKLIIEAERLVDL